MPITKSGQHNAPAWCGLSYFEVVTLAKGETRDFVRRGKREKPCRESSRGCTSL